MLLLANVYDALPQRRTASLITGIKVGTTLTEVIPHSTRLDTASERPANSPQIERGTSGTSSWTVRIRRKYIVDVIVIDIHGFILTVRGERVLCKIVRAEAQEFCVLHDAGALRAAAGVSTIGADF